MLNKSLPQFTTDPSSITEKNSRSVVQREGGVGRAAGSEVARRVGDGWGRETPPPPQTPIAGRGWGRRSGDRSLAEEERGDPRRPTSKRLFRRFGYRGLGESAWRLGLLCWRGVASWVLVDDGCLFASQQNRWWRF